MQIVRPSGCNIANGADVSFGLANSNDHDIGSSKFGGFERGGCEPEPSIETICKVGEITENDNAQTSWATTNDVWSSAQQTRSQAWVKAARNFDLVARGTIRGTQLILFGISRLAINSLQRAKAVDRGQV